jgi:membrane fusion protein, copper/silver efflux system
MKHTIRLLLFALAISGSFITGAWHNDRSRAEAAARPAAPAQDYVCPMHPDVRAGRPGECPACGMALVAAAPRTAPPGTLDVDARVRQLTGVQVLEVTRSSPAHMVRVVGRVAPEETGLYSVNAGVEGFVRDVSAITTGSQVRRGQVLASFSSPEAIPAIQNYIVAVNAMERLRESSGEGSAQAQITSTSSNFQQRVEKLEDLGLTASQLDEMQRTKLVPKAIDIVAPADGVVIARNIFAGQRFNRGTEWYRIADLRRVWVLADVFGMDAERFHQGMAVRVSLPDRQRTFGARVCEVLPQFDPATRTLKVRLEVDNTDYALRPDMFVDVELAVTLDDVIAVPADAVADSGLRQVVFVESGEGLFEPRKVRLGSRIGHQVEILEGLASGDRIAASGTFLLESASRMAARH